MTSQLHAQLYMACLKAIRDMGKAEFKKTSWFAWKAKKEETKKAA